MTKIERLKLRFASGMSEGRISEDEWLHEFLPMLEDAERYRWLRNMHERPIYPCPVWIEGQGNEHIESDVLCGDRADQAIDAARTPTKE